MQKQNEMRIFENQEFGKIRVVDIEGEPWWVLKDVCEILGLSNPSVIADRLDDDERAKFNLGRQGNTNIVNESGLYTVILRSDKPIARSFRKWITSEVLPSIRKHGAYFTDNVLDQLIDNPETAMKFFTALKEERAKQENLKNKQEALEEYIVELAPKVNYFDLVLQCPDAILPTVIAKDYGYSTVKFNRLLHSLGVQYRRDDNTWFLYQEHADKGYTITKTHILRRGNGEQFAAVWTYFTQRGRFWLYELLKEQGILPLAERSGIDGR